MSQISAQAFADLLVELPASLGDQSPGVDDHDPDFTARHENADVKYALTPSPRALRERRARRLQWDARLRGEGLTPGIIADIAMVFPDANLVSAAQVDALVSTVRTFLAQRDA